VHLADHKLTRQSETARRIFMSAELRQTYQAVTRILWDHTAAKIAEDIQERNLHFLIEQSCQCLRSECAIPQDHYLTDFDRWYFDVARLAPAFVISRNTDHQGIPFFFDHGIGFGDIQCCHNYFLIRWSSSPVQVGAYRDHQEQANSKVADVVSLARSGRTGDTSEKLVLTGEAVSK
jgi:hypothetical protein